LRQLRLIRSGGVSLIYVLYSIHIVCCLFLIMVVLLQQGKGADLSMFAGGSTQVAFGMRGAATLLHKLTVGFFVLFIMTTVSIGILQAGGGGSSIMLDVDTDTVEEAATTDATEPLADESTGESTDDSAASVASDPPAEDPEDGSAETTDESQN